MTLRPIRRLAIANRGEAAMRCLRAVKSLRAQEEGQPGGGLRCIAFYTEVDREAPFVRHADSALRLEAPRGAAAAYLDAEGLVDAFVAAGADAVWPGWGFLSEDAGFAQRVVERGLAFLGPSAEVMRALGDKLAAKRLAEAAGVPVLPWSSGALRSEEEAARSAQALGYPLFVKAAAGGGGRGIRAVAEPRELAAALRAAAAEARSAFGDDTLFLERRLARGRHVEVQIAADTRGAVLALGSRDCSVQRRHQKLIEEAPPPGLPEALREELEAAAVRLAQRAGYCGVGTVEFLVRGDEFFFLEVNPRLQVEHAITEELTGVDLVQLQIRIARGEALPALRPRGARHAIEVRVCAEDPEADFVPAPGRVARFEPPLGPELRVDSGIANGCLVPPDFDSLVAKLIASGETREQARARLVAALSDLELVIEGGATNQGFLLELLESPELRAGPVDVEWLDRTPALRGGSMRFAVEALVAAAILSYQRSRDAARARFFSDPTHLSPDRVPASTGQRVDLSHGSERYRLEVFGVGAWRYRVHLDGRVVVAALRGHGPHAATLELFGQRHRLLYDASERGLRVEIGARPIRFGSELAGQVRAASPAVVVSIDAAPGERVEAGAPLGRLEAMKTEIAFHAPVGGVVKEVLARTGQQVGAGELLLVIEPEETDPASQPAGGPRIAFPLEPDPLDGFFRDAAAEEVDLRRAESAGREARRAAIAAAREEIRRVLMGFDVNPARARKLAALLEAPLPEGLSEGFRWELAEIRHEIALFSDVETLFSRAPRAAEGEPGPSHHAQLRRYLRRMAAHGAGLDPEFAAELERALAHYGVAGLRHSEALERAVLRLLACQAARESRGRLVLAVLRRVQDLAESGIHLGDDQQLARALARIASLRGRLADAVADCAVDAGHAIFEAPKLEREAERTSKEVEAWLAAAEARPTQPPRSVLMQLAAAPRAVFDRVGRWLEDADPRRRAVAVAAHVRRLYAPEVPSTQTSGLLGDVHVERLDFPGGRVVLGGVARAGELAPTLARLTRAAAAATGGDDAALAHAVEILVPAPGEPDALRAEVAALLTPALPARRLTLSCFRVDRTPVHIGFERRPDGSWREDAELHELHPETARRIDLARLRGFELERLDAPEDLYAFRLRSREIPGDERIFVLADVRGRSPEAGHEMSLHLPAFERAFFDATRTLRHHLGLLDPRRLLQWNRILLMVGPAIFLDSDQAEALARRLAPATRHLGLEKVVVRLNGVDRAAPAQPPRPLEVVIADPTGSQMELSLREPHHAPLEPAGDYERKVVEARRRRLVYPYEIIRMLTGAQQGLAGNGGPNGASLPAGDFEEYDLEPEPPARARSVAGRAPGLNRSAVVFGVIRTPTPEVPEGMRRVLVLSDPTVGMGSLAAPECDRIAAALELAERLGLPLEWVPVSSGARIAMDSGTENLDATARVVRRIVHFTQAGGVIHVIVHGVNVGAQSYFNALATMLQHTRGALIMTPRASMVLTGRAALEASGSVSAEDEAAIGGFERVMGPNGEAQYYARDLADAYRILYEHYRYSYVVPGESGPRPAASEDPAERRVTESECEAEEDHDYARLGEIFDPATNPERKRPFSMRSLMGALVDRDGGHLERWRAWQGAETAIVWDARLGGRAVCLMGIESRNLAREGYLPADGPSHWTGGTLFPLSSKKVARALNAASGNRPAVVLANLSGFDGSPESMRKLQLEYGAEIARAVVNFRGPLLFLVVSRYHGGAYVVFSRALNDGLRAVALEGSFASVIGGAPAAAVVFGREVRARAAADPRIRAARDARDAGGDALERAWPEVLAEKRAELALEFDAVHSVERARDVGSLEALVEPARMRPFLIDLLDR